MSERADFATTYDVPRETMERLDTYAMMLADWHTRMNLVGPSTLDTVWTRHFADSAQLVSLAPAPSDATIWIDIGSGAGFPALVLALLCPGQFHLVEATAKKCKFLEAVAEAIGVTDKVVVHNARIEALPAIDAAILTARACASLTQLFDWGLRHGKSATWLLLKGQTAAEEVAVARDRFRFDAALIPSRTDERGRIVVARDVRNLHR